MDKTSIVKQAAVDKFIVRCGTKNAYTEYNAFFDWEMRYVWITHVGVVKPYPMPHGMTRENITDKQNLPTLWEEHKREVQEVQDNQKNPSCVCECTCMDF